MTFAAEIHNSNALSYIIEFNSDVIFPGFSNLPVNGKLLVNCHNLPVNNR